MLVLGLDRINTLSIEGFNATMDQLTYLVDASVQLADGSVRSIASNSYSPIGIVLEHATSHCCVQYFAPTDTHTHTLRML
jgi:hypothetical protein